MAALSTPRVVTQLHKNQDRNEDLLGEAGYKGKEGRFGRRSTAPAVG